MEKYEKMKSFDPEIYAAIQDETNRQNNKIELIASENFVSERIMEANGSPLTNKYAEGYPGKRYYGGCEHVDVVETLAIERAKELFGADFANVQAHSGAQANMAVFFALLTPGDTVLSMSLAHGGHLSHGSPVNMSGKYFNIVPYGVTEDTNTIDYDEVRRIALECKPKLILAGASAYPRIIDFKKFADIASEVGAYFMVDMAHIAGLVAAGCHPSPMPYADVVNTTTHKTLRGPRGGLILTVIPTSSSIFSASLPVTPVSVRFTSIRWLSVPPLTSLKPSAISVSARTDAFLTTCSAYVLKLGSSASLKHTALAAIVCIRGPP